MADARGHYGRGNLMQMLIVGSAALPLAKLALTAVVAPMMRRPRRRSLVSAPLLLMVVLAVASVANAQTSVIDVPEQPPAPAEDKPRWWQRITFAIGPGIGFERVSGTTMDDVTVEFFPINKNGNVGALPFGLSNHFAKGGFSPAMRVNVRARSTEAISAVEAELVSLGRINLKPVMGGVRWSLPLQQRLSTAIWAVTGYSFNRFDTKGAGGLPRHGRPVVALPASVQNLTNSWAWEMGGRLSFEMHPRVAFVTGVSLLHTKPTMTLTDGSQHLWDGNRFRLETGIAFTLLKGR